MQYGYLLHFIKSLYKKEKIALHEPVFLGKEKEYLAKCIDTTFVSYVGEFVTKFETLCAQYTEAQYALAVVNGTCALSIVLKEIGVKAQDEVITQPLTFVATVNAISHCGAYPVFVDVDKDTLGMSPQSLKLFLEKHTYTQNGVVFNKYTGNKISAIVPVHVFGHPCKIDEIIDIASQHNVPVVEDAAEAIGSFYKNKHCGTFGIAGILSFNGNKTITTGGGGMILTDNERLYLRLKHITTTAKVSHPWEYYHDDIGYNYRMPNVNAAIGAAQMEYIDDILKNKRQIAMEYKKFCEAHGLIFINEPEDAKSNYWLNAIMVENLQIRDEILEYLNNNGIMARAVWRLMHKLPMYKNCYKLEVPHSEFLAERIINLPSGVRI